MKKILWNKIEKIMNENHLLDITTSPPVHISKILNCVLKLFPDLFYEYFFNELES